MHYKIKLSAVLHNSLPDHMFLEYTLSLVIGQYQLVVLLVAYLRMQEFYISIKNINPSQK